MLYKKKGFDKAVKRALVPERAKYYLYSIKRKLKSLYLLIINSVARK